MPETRYNTETSYPEGLSAEEKTLDKAIIKKIPYEVSDEELEMKQLGRDANDASHRCAEGLANWDSMASSAQKALVKDILVVIKLLATERGLL